MQNIPAILEKITETSSTKEKSALIKNYKSPYLTTVLYMAYSPNLTYGITKLDLDGIEYNTDRSIDDRWFDQMVKLLTDLSRRELTGNRARTKILEFMSSGPEPWGLLIYNILNKDLRCGINTKLINSAIPELIETEFCMLAKPLNAKKITYPCYVDVKLDGVRTIANIEESRVDLYSRNGKPYLNYPHIEKELEILRNSLKKSTLKLDGEVTAGHFQDLMRSIKRKKDLEDTVAAEAIYNIFDVIDTELPLEDRLIQLIKYQDKIREHKLKHLTVVSGMFAYSETDLMRFYVEQRKLKQEGVMIKDLKGMYEYKRSTAWMKLKPTETIDLEVVGYELGTGKNSDKLGALVCKLPNGNLVSVGSGYSDDLREEFWKNRELLKGRIIEIEFQELTKDGSLRFPTFLRFRDDKKI